MAVTLEHYLYCFAKTDFQDAQSKVYASWSRKITGFGDHHGLVVCNLPMSPHPPYQAEP